MCLNQGKGQAASLAVSDSKNCRRRRKESLTSSSPDDQRLLTSSPTGKKGRLCCLESHNRRAAAVRFFGWASIGEGQINEREEARQGQHQEKAGDTGFTARLGDFETPDDMQHKG